MRKAFKPVLAVAILTGLGFVIGHWAYAKLFSSQTIVEGLVGQPRYINPLLAKTPIDQRLSKMFYRGLVKYDAHFQPQADLAENWQIQEEGKVYLIKLKSGQKWHDGKLITADDVIFTYQQMPELASVKIEKVDSLTVKFTLERPLAPVIELFSTGVLPKHLWQNGSLTTNPLNLKPIGSGRFHFKSLKVDGNWVRALLVNQDAPWSNKKSRFVFYQQESDLLTAYKLGQIDRFSTTNQSLANELASWPNTKVQISDGGKQNKLTLFFNLRKKDSPIADVQTRRALAQKLRAAGFNLTGPLPKEHWAYKEYQIAPSDANLANLSLNILIPKQKKLPLDLSKAWPGVKLNQQPTSLPPQTADWDVLVVTQQIGLDPDQFSFWHSSQIKIEEGELNLSGYQNRRVDQVLEKARQTTDRATRVAAYETWQRWLAKDVPAIFIRPPQWYNISRVSNVNITS